MTEYAYLREANVARQIEWDPDSQITLDFRANELAGEMGEACNVLKKLERERLGIRGSRDTVDHLGEELADVVMCVDMTAMDAGIDLPLGTGYPVGDRGCGRGARLAAEVGKVCTALLSDRRGLLGYCMGVERAARAIAVEFGIDLDAAIVAKFNAVSEKMGLQTRLAPALTGKDATNG